MGLLNHLFGGRKGLAKELLDDNKKRLRIWVKARKKYSEISETSKLFSNPNKIRQLLETPGEFILILDKLESSIDEELIDIEGEIKTEQEILSDLERLHDTKEETNSFKRDLANQYNDEKLILPIFNKIYEIYHTALNAIHLLRNKLRKKEEILIELPFRLWKILFHQLDFLYQAFDRSTYYKKEAGNNIHHIASKVLIGEELKKEQQKDEDKFVQNILEILHDGSEHYYRNLGRKIFSDLADMAWNDTSDKSDDYQWLEHLERHLHDDSLMTELVKKHHRRGEDNEINVITLVFRKSFDLSHFEAFLMHVFKQLRSGN